MTDSFTYTQFRVEPDGQTISFEYQIDHDGQTYNLRESLKFPLKLPETQAIAKGLRALHLALGVSYYKTFVSPTIVQPYAMDQAEADFWNDVWRGGLGEFLHINHLSPEKLAKFSTQDGIQMTGSSTGLPQTQAAILGIGGGKDSVVAGELLKQADVAVKGFVMATGEQLGQAKAVAETMGIELYVVERALDKQLLDLQEQSGAYKGHIPISLIFGLVGSVLASATGSSYVIVANEASASIPRITNAHGAVNHQWSKSYEFEKQLQRFVHENIAPGVTYFSAIRQLTSVAVAKLFAHYPQYFEVFTSDNFVFRIDPAKRPNARWSLESPKSLSSFILLGPWLSEEDMLRIFGRDFLDEAGLETLFKELVGIEGEPPLDCVGTVEELILSLNLLATQGKFKGSYLVKLAQEKGVIRDNDWQTQLTTMLQLQSDKALPEALQSIITKLLKQGLVS